VSAFQEGEEPSIAAMNSLMASPCLHLYELRAKDPAKLVAFHRSRNALLCFY